jgi:hypothetical protein
MHMHCRSVAYTDRGFFSLRPIHDGHRDSARGSGRECLQGDPRERDKPGDSIDFIARATVRIQQLAILLAWEQEEEKEIRRAGASWSSDALLLHQLLWDRYGVRVNYRQDWRVWKLPREESILGFCLEVSLWKIDLHDPQIRLIDIPEDRHPSCLCLTTFSPLHVEADVRLGDTLTGAVAWDPRQCWSELPGLKPLPVE